jgi:hypothetical protein
MDTRAGGALHVIHVGTIELSRVLLLSLSLLLSLLLAPHLAISAGPPPYRTAPNSSTSSQVVVRRRPTAACSTLVERR